jgi:NAD(P)-dependent dehydrogenase (short-subunit alcohol dehydrogenase family)
MSSTPDFLQDQHVLIAGGSSGMGLAVARLALQAGAVIHLVASNQARLEAAQQQLGTTNVHIYAVDISSELAVTALAGKIDHLDHLVTTAARLTFKPLAELNYDDINAMLGSKFWGPVLLTQKLAAKLRPTGSIVYFSGVAADKGGAGAAIVGAVNGALHGLAKNLVYELSPIRVNVVSPGVVDSPTWDGMGEAEKADFLQSVAEALPAKRVGHVEDLAQSALYLMTNKYVNGTVLTVDGGANA